MLLHFLRSRSRRKRQLYRNFYMTRVPLATAVVAVLNTPTLVGLGASDSNYHRAQHSRCTCIWSSATSKRARSQETSVMCVKGFKLFVLALDL